MDSSVTSIVSIIQSLGFPIAVCIYMFWDKQKQDKRNDARDAAQDARHGQYIETLTKLSDGFKTMTNTLTNLCEKLDTREGAVK